MAGIDSGVGVCYSAGTGVTCAGMDRIGRRAQFGGTGLLSGDAGGGYDITAFVYRAIYRQLFFDQKHTALKDGYFTLFNLQSPQEFLASAARIQNEEAARPLIGLFFTAIETGDEVASRYAAKGASHAADCIIAVANALSLESPVPVALSGSIMTAVASPTYRRMIDYELMRRRGDAFKTHINGKEPVEGAARWVRIRNHLESPL
jgi:N-acetylglucosamine kinase-like BadF-type ATPase